MLEGRKGKKMNKVPMTVVGFETLKEELRWRQQEERPRIIEAISEARAHGDLSENAEYHSAKEAQSLNEGRVNELEDLIARAEVIDVSKLSGDKIKFGATVVLVDEDMCIGCGLCAWACPYGAREMDLAAGVMKKCTLCVDRIYNETIKEVDRVPSCVRTCPANARHFGDLADPSSEVSRMVAERGGIDLMPEQGTKPVNKYLPPRPRKPLAASELPLAEHTDGAKGFFAWLDGMLDRI